MDLVEEVRYIKKFTPFYLVSYLMILVYQYSITIKKTSSIHTFYISKYVSRILVLCSCVNPSFFIHLMAFSDFTRTMMKQISFSVEKPCYVTATRTMMAKSTTTNYECCLCLIIKSPSTTQASSRRTHPKMATLDISWSEDLLFFFLCSAIYKLWMKP